MFAKLLILFFVSSAFALYQCDVDSDCKFESLYNANKQLGDSSSFCAYIGVNSTGCVPIEPHCNSCEDFCLDVQRVADNAFITQCCKPRPNCLEEEIVKVPRTTPVVICPVKKKRGFTPCCVPGSKITQFKEKLRISELRCSRGFF